MQLCSQYSTGKHSDTASSKVGEKTLKKYVSSISDICDRYKRGPFGYPKPAFPASSLT